MKLYLDTPEQFYEAVAELVKAGLTFEAYRGRLQITLTGGF